MSTQYVVTDEELEAVADAIRTKGGTNADLEWYSGFVSAIGAISGGGSSGADSSKQVSYLKWQITKTRNVPENNTLQVADFYLYQNTEKYAWHSNVSITSNMTGNTNEGVDKLLDGNSLTKYCTNAWGSSQTSECNIVISLGETITLDCNSSYNFMTANDSSSRDPISWKLYGSLDGTTWDELDSRDDATNAVPTTRNYDTWFFQMSKIGSGSGGSGVSGEYELLDYIQSDGTQCIDLGVKIPVSGNSGAMFQPVSGTGAYGFAFGAEYTQGNTIGLQIVVETGHYQWHYGSGVSVVGDISYDTPFGFAGKGLSSATETNVYAFSVNVVSAQMTTYASKIKLSYIFVGENLFLPCRRKSDNICGLWDCTNSQLLTDGANGNAFTAGNILLEFGSSGSIPAQLTLPIITTSNTILAEEIVSTYDESNSSSWGNLILSGANISKHNGALRLTSTDYAYYDFEESNHSFTIYMVGSQYEIPSSYANNGLRMISTCYEESYGNTIEFNSKKGLLTYGIYSNDVDTELLTGYTHVYALSVNNSSKSAKFYVDGVLERTASYNNSGRYINFTNQPAFNDYLCNCPMDVYYIAVIDGVDSESSVIANSQILMDTNFVCGSSPTPTQDDPFALTDYIESSGTQYIDTGYIIQSNTELELIFNIDNTVHGYPNPYGTRISYQNNEINFIFGDYTDRSWGRYSWSSNGAVVNQGISSFVNKKVVLTANKYWFDLISADNYHIANNNSNITTITNSNSLYLFGLDDGGTVNSETLSKMKLYRMRIYEGNTLVHEFVPWKDSSDVVCLKDTVTGNLKYNAGTGTFTYGTDS